MIPKVPDSFEDKWLIQLTNLIGSSSQPLFVDNKKESFSLRNECLPNVDEKIRKDGGTRILGWQVWQTEYLIEAEFHAIWMSPEGQLLDITPHPFPLSKVLFIPDQSITYDGSQIDNIRLNTSGNSVVDDLIKVCEAKFAISNKGNRAKEYNLKLTGDEAIFWELLQQMQVGLPIMLSKGATRHQTCFCGKDKYKKCHGKYLSHVLGRL
ncbi:hypothetical protein BEI46_18400 [Aliivibrio fischeri]|uniref:hypothetical protein n=1 Tax=Aliivibrio fischeri TaxID=668 RepID=UPI00084C5602|nr:hypothetical protein [Aliivibrio fischeri]OED52281.1 hypothetical protein BEI46_18400 [Aliivibrio fischeri]